MMKGHFDMRFIRELENESAVLIQRVFRKYRIKKLRPLVDGLNVGTQTSPIS